MGAEGYGGDDGRTTIFDYWSLPTLQGWGNGGKYDGAKLAPEAAALRVWYGKLLAAIQHPAFLSGEIFPLNSDNVENPAFGRLEGESASGHWLYAYLRANPKTGHAVLVVVNLHPSETLRGVKIQIPAEVQERAGLRRPKTSGKCLIDPEFSVRAASESLAGEGLPLPDLSPANAWIFDIGAR
jgi:hypothetical protein